MCGRYVSKHDATKDRFKDLRGLPGSPYYDPAEGFNFDARPTQSLPVIRFKSEGGIEESWLRWGLVPSWWKKPLKDVGSTINATVEKIKGKSGMWWTPFLRQRCLVPAYGFYEWQLQADGKTKVRHFIKLRDADVFTFAGLWDAWKQPDGEVLQSFAIVTCPANPLMAKIHNNPNRSDGPRMPVILTGETAKAWVDPKAELSNDERLGLLQPYAQEAMVAYPVVSTAKKPEELIEPVGEPVTA